MRPTKPDQPRNSSAPRLTNHS